jgi:predicted HAD superfamily hydrolase
MKAVFDIVKNAGKRIVVITDMYYSSKILHQILDNLGYDGIEEMFVSSEYRCRKSEGLFSEAIKQLGITAEQMCHIGDNEVSDIRGAINRNILPIKYYNVRSVPNFYCPDWLYPEIRYTFHRSLLKNQLNCGYRYTPAYEFGYSVFGIFVLGFVSWIHRRAVTGNFDKILFVARDGYLSSKAYEILFDGAGTVKGEYFLSSKYAIWFTAKYANSFNEVIDYLASKTLTVNKESKNITVRQAICEGMLGLSSVRDKKVSSYLESIADILPSELGNAIYGTKLNNEIRDCLLKNKDAFLNAVETQRECYEEYVNKVTGGGNRFLFADGVTTFGAMQQITALSNMTDAFFERACMVSTEFWVNKYNFTDYNTKSSIRLGKISKFCKFTAGGKGTMMFFDKMMINPNAGSFIGINEAGHPVYSALNAPISRALIEFQRGVLDYIANFQKCYSKLPEYESLLDMSCDEATRSLDYARTAYWDFINQVFR